MPSVFIFQNRILKRITAWVCAVFVLGLFIIGPISCMKPKDTETSYADLVRDFQLTLDDLRLQHGFPGATAAFILPDGRYAGVSTGFADMESQISMGTDARIFSGSIGKTFVAAVTLALVNEGKLDLDKNIEEWLGEEEWFGRLPNGKEITLRMLLNHSSGLKDHVYTAKFAAAVGERLRAGDADNYFKPRELVECILDEAPLFPPGEGYAYTDTGYIIVGLIIEKACGRPYYTELQERFLIPLGLNLTTPTDRRIIAGLVPGYLAEDNPLGLPVKSMQGGQLVFHPGSEWTGGGLATNSKDLVRWAKSLYEGKALPQSMVNEMLTSTVERKNEKGELSDYGLGVLMKKTKLGVSYGHGGWYPGYDSILVYFPEKRVAVAVQVNRDFENPSLEYAVALAHPVIDALPKITMKR